MQSEIINPDSVKRSLSLVRWLAGSWLVLMLLGFLALRVPESLRAGQNISLFRCAFTSTNFSTLSGFTQTFAQPGDFAFVPQLIFLMQTLSGAMLTLIGGGVLMARWTGSRHTDSRIATAGLLLIGIGIAIGMLTVSRDESLLDAVSRGAGLIAGSAARFGVPHGSMDWMTHILILPISVLGAIGVVVVLDLWDFVIRRIPVSGHALGVLGLAAGIYLVSTFLLAQQFGVLEWGRTGLRIDRPALLRASALSLGAWSGAGTSETVSQISAGAQWILMGVMLAGTGTLGTAGGFGLAWLFTMPARLTRELAGRLVATSILGLTGLVMLSGTEPQLAPHAIHVLVVSGLMNAGISSSPVAIDGPGLLVMTGLLVAGRLVPLVVAYGFVHHLLCSRER